MLYLLPHAVDRAAHRAPEHEAMRYAGASLTYAALAQRADRLAGLLRAQGVRRGDRVAIHAGKGLAAAVALYGIMKAGAAYVPLDPSSPPGRQAFILRDCGIRHVVTEPSRRAALRLLLAEGVPVECVVGVDNESAAGVRAFTWSDVDAHPAVTHDADLVEMDLAYVLYTSGSTGTPKGVAHSHRSALAFARVAADTYGFSERRPAEQPRAAPFRPVDDGLLLVGAGGRDDGDHSRRAHAAAGVVRRTHRGRAPDGAVRRPARADASAAARGDRQA